jgi:hypothetical protein
MKRIRHSARLDAERPQSVKSVLELFARRSADGPLPPDVGSTAAFPSSTPVGRRDLLLAGLMFTATVLYWIWLPHSLGPADESVHLYEAKRVLDGEVLYRDVFNFITPGWFYLMASLFWLFGTSIETARTAMAVMHGVTMLFVYFSCRRLGIWRGLAWLPPLGYLVICQSAWLIVSQHWVSTLLCAALLFVCAGRVPGRTAWALWAGVVLGLLIGVQQQRGAFMAAGVAVWLLADALLRWRYAATPSAAAFFKEAAALAAGTGLVVGALLAVAVARAGLQPVWYALVIFPLFNYRSEMHCPWGDVNIMTAWNARFTFPLVLKYLPAVLLLSAARLVVLWRERRDLATAQNLLLLLILSGASALSIAYFPDFIKISFIAFIFLVAAAENLAWLVGRLAAPPRVVAGLAWLVAAFLVVAGGRQLYANLLLLRREFPVSHATAFGRVEYPTAAEATLRDEVATLLASTPSRALYAYPILSDLYLTIPADNPTPYGFFLAGGYHSRQEVQRVIDILKQRQLPYVVMLPGLVKPDDVVGQYITEAYEPMSPTPLAGRVIYRRKRGP